MSTPQEEWSLRALLDAAGVRAVIHHADAPHPETPGGPDNSGEPDNAGDPRVTSLQFDSRRVRTGSLYLAMPGLSTHGARFAQKAVEQGAVGVLTDAAGLEITGDLQVPVVVVEEPRVAMAALAVAFHHQPSSRVPMFAVTGTNGKTTTMFLLDAALSALGLKVGTLGTIGFRLGGEALEWQTSTVTTPEAPDLQELFDQMIDRGARAVAMEVSSHALALHRADGTHFRVAGFTMLGRDHLDFHRDMEDYFCAKARLFTSDLSEQVVVNADSDWGRRLVGMVRESQPGKPITTVGRHPSADVRIVHDVLTSDGLGRHVGLEVAGERVDFILSMPGDHNVENAALALAMVRAAGLDMRAASRGLAHAQVPGRMQQVDLGPGAPTVVVDFAHTPQAVEEAIEAVVVPGRTITVIGAGGDRDREKRPLMGAAAGHGSDTVVVTDDNPRTEDPATIRAAVTEGVITTNAELLEVPGRRQAIREALRRAGADDVVLVLGKGHERGQIVGDQVLDFDDVEVVREEWASLRRESEGSAG